MSTRCIAYQVHYRTIHTENGIEMVCNGFDPKADGRTSSGSELIYISIFRVGSKIRMLMKALLEARFLAGRSARDCHPCIRAGYEIIGRSGRIRTCDPLVPNEVRYQAAPHSEKVCFPTFICAGSARVKIAALAISPGLRRLPVRTSLRARRRMAIGGPARKKPGLLGRSQAVRQRFLVPPRAGSNPAAPASILLTWMPSCMLSKRANIQMVERPNDVAEISLAGKAGSPTRGRNRFARVSCHRRNVIRLVN
jgi:hypothetical protein